MGNLNLSELGKDLLINIINIVVLFLVVKLLVYKPVKKFLDDRKARVEGQKAEAEKMMAQAKETLNERDSIISESKLAAEEEISLARKKAAQEAKEITEEAKKNAEKIINEAKLQTESEKKRATIAAKSEFADIAVNMAEKILCREVSAADNKRAVDEFLKELGVSDEAN